MGPRCNYILFQPLLSASLATASRTSIRSGWHLFMLITKRAKDTILALKALSGGAMQAANMADVTPKFIVLASTTSGNHPFSHIAVEDKSNRYAFEASINLDALREVLTDYKSQIIGTVYIGKRKGFMDEFQEELEKLASEFENVKLLPVNEAIDSYCEQLESQIKHS